MKNNKIIRLHSSLVFAALLLGACTFPVTMSDDFTVEISGPTNGMIVPLGEPVYVRSTATSTTGNIIRLLFFDNGTHIFFEYENPSWSPRPETANTIATWIPEEIGETTLQVAAQRRGAGGYGYSDIITVCVLPFSLDGRFHDLAFTNSLSPETVLIQYDGDCIIPEPSSPTPGPLDMEATATPESISFVPTEINTLESCASPTPITFEVRLSDTRDEVAIVTVSVLILPSIGTSNVDGWMTDQQTLILNHTGDDFSTSPRTKIYSMTYDFYSNVAASTQNVLTDISSGAELTWMARAFNRDGETLLQEGYFTIPANAVTCEGSPYLMTTSAPLIIAPTGTATPASALDCPPGTYFSDTTNKCIAIQIPPTKKPGGDGISCSDHGSKDSCSSAGCSWNANLNKCQ